MKCEQAPFGVCVPLVGAASPRCKFCGRSMLDGDRHGRTYERQYDFTRLNAQCRRVFDALSDGQWRTPEELERMTGDRWASISARVRDLRKREFGAFQVERRSLGNGQFAYRLLLPERVTA